jgi:hypothetical protein
MVDNDKIILICATGRSGSTTLQRIINSIPNSNICGENFGAINSLLDFYRKLHYSSKTHIPGHYNPASYESIINNKIKPSWYNSYKISEMEDCIRNTIITMLKKEESNNVWGFKEIRYDNNNIFLIHFFKKLFPQTKVIIQIRENIVAQSNSSWHKKNKNAIVELAKNNKELLDFYNSNKEWCYFTTFEKMFDKENLENIFQFIDCRENFNKEKVFEILNTNLKD